MTKSNDDLIRDALYVPKLGQKTMDGRYVAIEKTKRLSGGKVVSRCEAKRFGGWHFHQCFNSGVVERGGHNFCRQCDPIAKHAKEEEARRLIHEQLKRRRADYERADRIEARKADVVRIAKDVFAQMATFDDLERAVAALVKAETS
jgi:hypothetical protein